jgi:hypothetical protein
LGVDYFVSAWMSRNGNAGTGGEFDAPQSVRWSGGWRFHDWQDFQPTKSAVVQRRTRDAERLRKWREQRDSERGE